MSKNQETKIAGELEPTGFCPQMIAAIFSATSLDNLFTLHSTISQVIDKRLVKLRKEAKKGTSEAASSIGHHPIGIAVAPAKEVGKLDAGGIQKAFRDCECSQIDIAVSALQKLAAKKRKNAA